MRSAPPTAGTRIGGALAFTLAVAVLLLVPLPIPSEGSPSTLFGLPYLDKLAHLLVFLGLGWIWRRSLARSGRSVSYLTVFVAVVGYGGLLELLQGASGLRTAEWGDLVADALGAGLVPLGRWSPVQAGRAGTSSEAGPVDSR